MESNYFQNLSPQQLTQIIESASILYCPIGSLEWHERHLPFGVDVFIAQAICEGACARSGGCILPPLYFGTDTVYSEEGNEYRGMNVQSKRVLPGSIYPLDEGVFYALLKQVIENAYTQGFKKVVVVTGHCEPTQMKIVSRIYNEFKVKGCIVFPREGVFFEGSLDHAGAIETRLMMAIKPELVHLERLNKPYEALIGDDPHQATREEGEKQLEKIVTQLVNMIVG